MKKLLIIIFLTIVIFLVACQQEPKDLREIEDVTLIEKKDIRDGSRFPDYVFVLEKNGQSVQLFADNEYQYESVKEGTIINLLYDAGNYTVEKIYLVELEKEVKEDE